MVATFEGGQMPEWAESRIASERILAPLLIIVAAAVMTGFPVVGFAGPVLLPVGGIFLFARALSLTPFERRISNAVAGPLAYAVATTLTILGMLLAAGLPILHRLDPSVQYKFVSSASGMGMGIALALLWLSSWISFELGISFRRRSHLFETPPVFPAILAAYPLAMVMSLAIERIYSAWR